MSPHRYLTDPLPAAPLAIFRIGFGLMMALSVVRFWANGWIEKLYLEPTYFFSYRYFEWVKPLGPWTYAVFGLAFVSAVLLMLGWHYRWAAAVFFLSFTYVELMDKTTYLNHYYLVSILAFVLVWLPAGARLSVDRGNRPADTVPRWTLLALRVIVGVVYVYAGLAKLNSDWLLHAQPLATWLPAKYSLPLLGDLLQQRWVHFAFAWAGAAYDLFIPFFLLWGRTRYLAFALVVVFHVLTRVLFPIGMFPYVMIISALVFFPPRQLERWLQRLGLRQDPGARTQVQGKTTERRVGVAGYVVAAVVALHLLLPWRYALAPGELFWTEHGYRFSWRVMLMEKAGYLNYRVVDPATGRARTVDPGRYLTTFQQKQLATQPDFILEFAHFLAQEFRTADGYLPAVYAESYVALNGRRSRPYVDPAVNLTEVSPATPRTDWLLPFNDTIYGL